jgi:hypothetical protein
MAALPNYRKPISNPTRISVGGVQLLQQTPRSLATVRGPPIAVLPTAMSSSSTTRRSLGSPSSSGVSPPLSPHPTFHLEEDLVRSGGKDQHKNVAYPHGDPSVCPNVSDLAWRSMFPLAFLVLLKRKWVFTKSSQQSEFQISYRVGVLAPNK